MIILNAARLLRTIREAPMMTETENGGTMHPADRGENNQPKWQVLNARKHATLPFPGLHYY